MKTYIKENIFTIIMAYFSAFALCNIGHIETTNIITVAIFMLCFITFRRIDTIRAKRVPVILSFIFSLLYILAEYNALTGGLSSRLFCFLYLLFTYIGLMALFYKLLCCLYALSASFSVFCAPPSYTGTDAASSAKRNLYRHFGIYTMTILLCQLPYFLYQYPGVMTPDSINQYKQIVGILPYSNHHPWIHTMLIRFSLSIGKIFTEDLIFGIAVYTMLQMAIMALIESFFLITLEKQGLRIRFRLLFLCFFALVPYNALFAVTMWKDVLFAGGLLLYTTVLYRFCLLSQEGKALSSSRMTLILFLLSSFSICLMRSNGWYAFLLMTPFCIYFFRKYIKTIVLLHMIVFLAVLTVKGPVMKFYNVAPTEFVEALSVPIQQIARVVADERELTPEQWDLLEKVCDTAQIAPQYNPSLSDPMKNLLYLHGTEYLNTHKSEYFSLWLSLGMKYPADYLEAYIDQTRGYWFGGPPIGLGNEGIIANDLGLTWHPLIRGALVIKIYELCSKLYSIFPLLGILWSMGGLLWIVLAALGNCIVNGRKQYCILYLPSIAVMLSVIVSTPVASEFRYAYAFILTVPLLLSVSMEHADLSIISEGDTDYVKETDK